MGRIKLWDAVTLSEIATLHGRGGGVTALAFSPDGRHLAAAYFDSLTVLWPLNGATDTLILRGHRGGVTSLAYSFLGATLATGGADRMVRIWDPESGREELHYGPEENGITALGFGGLGLLVVASGKSIHVWDRFTHQSRCSFSGHVGDVYAVAPVGLDVVTAGQGGTIVWSPDTCREVRRLAGHSNTVFSLARSGNELYLASGSADGTVKVWNPRSGAELFDLRGHLKTVNGVAFSSDGRRLYTASDDSTVRAWDASRVMDEMDVQQQPSNETDAVRSVTFNPKRGLIAAVNSSRGDVLVSDLARPRRSYTQSLGTSEYLYAATFSPDGERVAVGGDRGVRILDAKTGNEQGQLDPARLADGGIGGVRAIAFNPDGSRIAIGGTEGPLAIWIPSTDSVIPLRGHEGRVFTVTFSPTDGDRLLSGGTDGLVLLWDLRRPSPVPDTVEQSHSRVMSVAFSWDGKKLATAGEGVITLYSGTTPRTATTLARMATTIWSVAFSPDNKQLASAGFDGTARTWEVSSGREVLRLRGHVGRAYSVAFSQDSKYVASSGEDGIHVSIIDPRVLLLKAWTRVSRELTEDECRIFDLQVHGHCPPVATAVVAGERLAREGDATGAAARFNEARRLDETFATGSADSLARALTMEARITRGLALLSAKRMTDAMVEFRQAQGLDAHRATDIVPEVAGGIAELLRGRDSSVVDSALAVYREAVRWDNTFTPTAQTLNSLCWWGTLAGRWRDVASECETAVRLSPENGNIRDSRGLNRALNGDRAGAAADFQYFVTWSAQDTYYRRQRAKRIGWIPALRAGRNPFTAAVLAQLRIE